MSIEAMYLLEELKRGGPGWRVFRVADGSSWFVWCGGRKYSERAVMELVAAGEIRDVYSTLPNECYWLGRTIDTARSEQLRARLGGKAPLVYVGEPSPMNV
jgi:hypothetical protein